MSEQPVKRGPGRPRKRPVDLDGGGTFRSANSSVADELMVKVRAHQERMERMEQIVAPCVIGGRSSIKPYPGMDILYVVQDGLTTGDLRPGKVIEVIDTEQGAVSLCLFLNPDKDSGVSNWEPMVLPGYGPGQWRPQGRYDVQEDESNMTTENVVDRVGSKSEVDDGQEKGL